MKLLWMGLVRHQASTRGRCQSTRPMQRPSPPFVPSHSLPLRGARALVALWVLTVASGCSCGAQTGAPRFREPSGPFAVGVKELAWRDPTRAEPRTKDPDDHPAMSVRMYWPTERSNTEGLERARYLDPDEFTSIGRLSLELTGIPDDLRMPAYEGVPLANRERPVDVIFSSPGYTSARMLNSYQALDVASHGYVVISVEHLGDGVTHWESPSSSSASRCSSGGPRERRGATQS